MSSFLFLHFCDDVFELLGLYFSAFILSRVSSGGFLPLPPKPPQGSHTASTGLVCGFAGVAFPTRLSKTCTQGRTGPGLVSPQNELTPPPKGGGAGYHLGWVRPARSQPGYAGPTGPVWGLRWCRSPTRPPKLHKGPHRGRVWFLLTRWHFSERISCSFSELSCKNSGRRKKSPLPCF